MILRENRTVNDHCGWICSARNPGWTGPMKNSRTDSRGVAGVYRGGLDPWVAGQKDGR